VQIRLAILSQTGMSGRREITSPFFSLATGFYSCDYGNMATELEKQSIATNDCA